MTGILTFIIIITAILVVVLKNATSESKPANSKPANSKPANSKPMRIQISANQSYYASWKTIGLSPRQGYQKQKMVGMGHRSIGASELGKFEGYAMAQTDNMYDPYAIAIHREDSVHVGFLERGNARLHRYITEQGGIVHCYGYIACGGLDGAGRPISFYAEVCVETDKRTVSSRNKAYDTDDKFYNYKEGELKALLDKSQA